MRLDRQPLGLQVRAHVRQIQQVPDVAAVQPAQHRHELGARAHPQQPVANDLGVRQAEPLVQQPLAARDVQQQVGDARALREVGQLLLRRLPLVRGQPLVGGPLADPLQRGPEGLGSDLDADPVLLIEVGRLEGADDDVDVAAGAEHRPQPALVRVAEVSTVPGA